MRGGEFSPSEAVEMLDYCQEDVDALARLLPVMLPLISLPHALIRGANMGRAVAHVERNGVPIDVPTLDRLRTNWDYIQEALIERSPVTKNLYDGRSFRIDKFEQFLDENGFMWPYLDSGQINLKDETFSEMADLYGEKIRHIYDTRNAMSKTRMRGLEVGKDGRNRVMQGVFGSKTGRNQPSNSKGIYGPSKWMRGLIKPQPGFGIAELHYGQQEFGIAGALSRDPKMMQAYETGDSYLGFAIQAGAVPPDAKPESHKQAGIS